MSSVPGEAKDEARLRRGGSDVSSMVGSRNWFWRICLSFSNRFNTTVRLGLLVPKYEKQSIGSLGLVLSSQASLSAFFLSQATRRQ